MTPNLSHWHATAPSALATDELPARAEVVVIGAGVLGAATAYWLARKGARPLLIERGGPAAGASGHNGGLLVSASTESYLDLIARVGHEPAHAIRGLARTGYTLLSSLIEEEGIACNLRPQGHLLFALNPAQFDDLRREADALQRDGFAFELLDRAAATARIGIALGDEVVGGVFNPDGAALHSARLVQGLLAAARRHGARLCFDTAVTALHADGAGLRLETTRGTVVATTAVAALNAWTGDLLPELAPLIVPVRGQVLTTVPGVATLACSFGARLTPTGEYGQQTTDGALLFGGCRALAPDRDVGKRELVTSAVVQDALEAGLARLFPALARWPIARRWAGLMAFSPDYLPIVDRAPALPALWYAGGFSGHGMPYAPIFGYHLAEAVLSGQPAAELSHFRHDRSEGRVLKSEG